MRRIKIQEGYTLFVADSIKESKEKIARAFKKHLSLCVPFDILCPTYMDTKKYIFYAGGGFTQNELLPYPDAQYEQYRNQYPTPREVDFSPLWAFVISDQALKKLGPIPNFGKDIYQHADFCVRAAKAKFKIKVVSQVRVTYLDAYTYTNRRKRWIKKITESKNEFEKKYKKFLMSKYRLPVVFHSHTGYPGGYCMHARSLIKALSKKYVRIFYKFIGGCNDDEPLADDFLVDDLRNDMGSMRLPQVVLSTGLNCFSNSGDYKIGFTTTEVDGIPKDWVKVLNEMDEVWTTSEFSKWAFKKSKVKPPVYNMREGIDPNYFHPGAKPMKYLGKEKFLFISNFAWGRRKGVDLLFEAFSKEFSDDEGVALVIKALPSYHGEDIKKQMTEMYNREHGAPIYVWDTVVQPYLIPGFYTMGQCFVFPTRGEGFGIPPLEALACGVPVITTDYSAQTEYLKRDGKVLPGVELLKYKIEKFDGSDSIYYRGFNWARPSISHLRKLMRKVYNNYEKYKAGAMESSEYVRKEWTWDKAADLVIDRLKIISKKMGKPKSHKDLLRDLGMKIVSEKVKK